MLDPFYNMFQRVGWKFRNSRMQPLVPHSVTQLKISDCERMSERIGI
jgi:hypothetical protein